MQVDVKRNAVLCAIFALAHGFYIPGTTHRSLDEKHADTRT